MKLFEPPHIRMVLLCMTIDDPRISEGRFGSRLLRRFSVNTSTDDKSLLLPSKPPAIIDKVTFPEIKEKSQTLGKVRNQFVNDKIVIWCTKDCHLVGTARP